MSSQPPSSLEPVLGRAPAPSSHPRAKGAWVTPTLHKWRNLPGRVVTKSTKACELERWSLVSFPRDGSGRVNLEGAPEFVPFRCGSWRCRRCAPAVGASDFTRVSVATTGFSRWHYLVLTVNPADFEDQWDAFGSFYRIWQDRLRKRIERFANAQGVPGRIEYVMTFERNTRTGFPHANVLIGHGGLERATDSWGLEVRKKGKRRDGRVCHLPKWRPELVKMVTGSGLGKVVWLEAIQSPEAWAGYITKLAHELVGAEVKSQTPFGAPKGFRRLRATRGTLPPTFATVRAREGLAGERAWAMTSKASPAFWKATSETNRKNLGKLVFLENAAEKEILGHVHASEDRLRKVRSAMRGEVDWSHVVSTWATELEEITGWNASKRKRAREEGSSAIGPDAIGGGTPAG